MASVWYPKFVEAALAGAAAGTLRAYLIDVADYVYSAAHDFLDDIPAAARVSFVALTSVTFTNGVLDAADATFVAVTGDPSEAIAIVNWTGTEGTSRILLYLDTATGLPVTPNGGDINVVWDNGANKIGRLV
jgi:hypothetical protein